MIKLENISKVFNAGSAAEVVALKELNLIISKGEFVTIIGSNGSGKSTLLNLLSGTVMPDSGKIVFNNTVVSSLPEHRRCKWISRVFQNPMAGTASELSILENFRLAAIRTKSKSLSVGTGPAFRAQVKEKISGLGLGLENKIEQAMGTLSGGQRQALTLLMAVMDETDILLLDEPTAALDPRTSEHIMQLADKIIREYQLTALLVTHNLKDALAYGSRLLLMQEGAIEKDLIKKDVPGLELSELFNWF